MKTIPTLLVAASALFAAALSLQAATDFSWPTSGGITGIYGEPRYVDGKFHHYHQGVDIANSAGTPVRAARGGTITFAGSQSGYGKVIYVTHSYGYESRYGHNNTFYRTSGAVDRGWLLAYMGSTGTSSGPHCHFEIRRYGTAQSIPGNKYAAVSVGRDVPKDYPAIHN